MVRLGHTKVLICDPALPRTRPRQITLRRNTFLGPGRFLRRASPASFQDTSVRPLLQPSSHPPPQRRCARGDFQCDQKDLLSIRCASFKISFRKNKEGGKKPILPPTVWIYSLNQGRMKLPGSGTFPPPLTPGTSPEHQFLENLQSCHRQAKTHPGTATDFLSKRPIDPEQSSVRSCSHDQPHDDFSFPVLFVH